MNNKNCFDFIRVTLALQILVAHLSELSQNKDLLFLSNFVNPYLAVKSFFIISGFLVAKSYANTVSLKQYFYKRIKRIVPAYAFVIIIAALGLSFVSSSSFTEYFSNIDLYKYIGWNLVFLNFVQPCLPQVFEKNLFCVVNGSLWTLKIEEGFYIILPLLFYCIKKTKKTTYTLIIIYLLSILYSEYMTEIGKPLLSKQLPGQLSYFVVGMFLFFNIELLLKHKKTLFLLGLTILTLINVLNIQLNILYPLILGVTIISAAYSLSIVNHFGKYGDFTYGLYIYHFPIIQIFRHYNLFETNNPYLMAVAVLVITMICAVFSWFVIEKRFIERYNTNQKTIVV